MDSLIFNAVLRIESDDLLGFHRVVAVPAGRASVWLAFVGLWGASGEASPGEVPKRHLLSQVAVETLEALSQSGKISNVHMRPNGKLLAPPENLNDTERRLWELRCAQAAPLLDPRRVCDALADHGSIAPLIREMVEAGATSRATAHRLWHLLCVNGFEAASLYPRFDRCGAPGVLRPAEGGRRKNGRKPPHEQIGMPDPAPQRGVTTDDRLRILHHARALMKPGLSLQRLYPQLIERIYVTQYEETEHGRKPIVPPQGSYPNVRQVRHIVETGIAELERVRRKTTLGHFERNLRGLRGRAYDGVAGPGHAYAIDSTIGDVHLRSAINRAWPVGRPIVYVVVDVWSTAIVGFYACLMGPSWDTAKLALFSTCFDPKLLSELWGYQYVDVLHPAPTIPFHFWTDRGEYVSAAARRTCEILSISLAVNAAYRPDLKGLVEVLHRIAKDWQSTFLPGAIDARRPELDLRAPSAKQSALTLREYVQYLHGVFAHYNLCADRSHRMTSEMIATGAEPTPAGLWRFGHEAGFGYRKAIPQDRLITGLLRQGTAVTRRDGVFFEALQYESEIVAEQQWTAQARNFGSVERTAFHFPGSLAKFWWPDPDGSLQEFRLRGNARAPSDVTLEEWLDALAYEKLRRARQQQKRVEAAVCSLQAQRELREQAIARTAEADAAYVGARLNVREARALETTPVPPVPPAPREATQQTPLCDAGGNAGYDAVMDALLAEDDRNEDV